jgi:hypothetical protein
VKREECSLEVEDSPHLGTAGFVLEAAQCWQAVATSASNQCRLVSIVNRRAGVGWQCVVPLGRRGGVVMWCGVAGAGARNGAFGAWVLSACWRLQLALVARAARAISQGVPVVSDCWPFAPRMNGCGGVLL